MENAFEDRAAAGRLLAQQLQDYAGRDDVIVLALPRGGVPVAYEVAKALGVALDVLVVRKLGVPFNAELAMGALASGGALYVDQDVLRFADVTQQEFDTILEQERAELERREVLYRGSHPPIEINGKTVIVVDDGIATGASMRAAIAALRSNHPARVIVAVPVAPVDTPARLEITADDFICVMTPSMFYSVGQFYDEFDQTADVEVRNLLQQAPR